MDPAVVGVFIPILGVLGLFGLAGLKMWSNYKLRMRETAGGDNERLTETVQQLQDDADDTRAQLAEMQERLDFAERMLAAGRPSQEDRNV